MVICVGRATKIVQFVTDFGKAYEAEIYLGKRSSTFDGEGVIEDDMPKAAPDFSVEEFTAVLGEFKGTIRVVDLKEKYAICEVLTGSGFDKGQLVKAVDE